MQDNARLINRNELINRNGSAVTLKITKQQYVTKNIYIQYIRNNFKAE